MSIPTSSSPKGATTDAMDMLQIERLSLDTSKSAQESSVHKPEPSSKKRTTLYPKIQKLTDFVYAARRLGPDSSIHLTGSVKLHGTHADIVFIEDTDEIRLQSRNQLALTVDKDNAGFAAFIAATDRKLILDLRNRILQRYHRLNPGRQVIGDAVVAGEWCGPGIQRKVAVAKLPKFFAIISININNEWLPDWEYSDIRNEDARFFHISKAGFFTQQLHFDDVIGCEQTMQQLTDAVEKECPFAKALGVSGRGEGIVWKATDHCSDPELWFKSKGDLSAVSLSNKLPASAVAPANRERVHNIAKAIATENRLERGWDYLAQKNAAGLGDFMKWVLGDCLVEERREMKELKITKRELSPAIANITKPWFEERIQRERREDSERG